MTVINVYDEKALFARIAKGDEGAFRIIFDLYKRRLYRYILNVSKSDQVAEELVNDVFLKLWSQQNLLIGVQNPATYIFTIAKNKARDHLKKVASEARLLEVVWTNMESFHDDTQELLQANESDRLIKMAIEQLSPQKKIIYQLSRQEDLSHEQIAERLNISKSTVNNHLVNALKQIRAFLVKNNSEALVLFIVINVFR